MVGPVPRRERRRRGRKPRELPDSARLVLDALDGLVQWTDREPTDGSIHQRRFLFSEIRDAVLDRRAPAMQGRPRDTSLRRTPEYHWADVTTDNGLKALGKRGLVHHEAGGTYTRVFSVGGVILDVERELAELRLHLDERESDKRDWRRWDGNPPLGWARNLAKDVLVRCLVRAERALDRLTVDGWSQPEELEYDIEAKLAQMRATEGDPGHLVTPSRRISIRLKPKSRAADEIDPSGLSQATSRLRSARPAERQTPIPEPAARRPPRSGQPSAPALRRRKRGTSRRSLSARPRISR